LSRLLHGFDNISGNSISHNFAHRPAAKRDRRRAARHGLDHDQTKRLRPVNGKEQRIRIAQKFFFTGIAHLAQKLNQRMVKEWTNFVLHVPAIFFVDLSRDLERHSCAFGDLYRSIRTFFRRNSAKKQQVLPTLLFYFVKVEWQAVIDCAAPTNPWQWRALRVGN